MIIVLGDVAVDPGRQLDDRAEAAAGAGQSHEPTHGLIARGPRPGRARRTRRVLLGARLRSVTSTDGSGFCGLRPHFRSACGGGAGRRLLITPEGAQAQVEKTRDRTRLMEARIPGNRMENRALTGCRSKVNEGRRLGASAILEIEFASGSRALNPPAPLARSSGGRA
jgi:hypothetical protein